jgi:hypothetical protein
MRPESDGSVTFVTLLVPTELAFAAGATLQFATLVTVDAPAPSHRVIFEVRELRAYVVCVIAACADTAEFPSVLLLWLVGGCIDV